MDIEKATAFRASDFMLSSIYRQFCYSLTMRTTAETRSLNITHSVKKQLCTYLYFGTNFKINLILTASLSEVSRHHSPKDVYKQNYG